MSPNLDAQRDAFKARRLIATPIAGLIAWAATGIAGAMLSTEWASLALYISVGSIAYLAMLISKFTGEDFLAKDRPKNTFDRLFFYSMGSALMMFAIAIPFALIEPSSLPLSVGIMLGVMWGPLSWIIQHWVGLFHLAARTAGCAALWYLFPDHRFTIIPLFIVIIYIISIIILEKRYRDFTA